MERYLQRTVVLLLAAGLLLGGLWFCLDRVRSASLHPPLTVRGTAAYRVSFGRPVKDEDVRTIEVLGGRILEVDPPDNLWTEIAPEAIQKYPARPRAVASSHTSAQATSTSAVPAQPQWSAVTRADKLQDGLDLSSPLPQPLTLLPLADQDLVTLERRVVELGGSVIGRVGHKDGLPRLRVMLSGTSLASLADVAEVRWIERFVRPRLLNDVAVGPNLMNVESARTEHGLTGRGQVITTSDSGIDTGDLTTMHEDLRTNVIGFAKSKEGTFTYWDGGEQYSTSITPTDISGHGTHTAGSICGAGEKSNGRFKGVAYEAKLWAWFCSDVDGYVWTPDDFADTFRPSALGSTNVYIHSASWGGYENVYNTSSQAIDLWCWNHPDFLPVFAAGNEGKDSTICAEGGAKNVLCVGATESLRSNKGSNANNPDELAYFSSRGPMPDGRIKPDVCAPGTYIISTRSSQSAETGWGIYNADYLYNSGTSMATPLTAGTVALIRQWLVEEGGFTNQAPSAALMKAMITGGATRLGDTVPNKSFGWGRVNLMETLFPTNGMGVVLKDYIPFSRNSVQSFEVVVTNAAPLDVQLCWIDAPRSLPSRESSKKLVIDLDLVVSNQTTGVTYSPNDHVNNLESVRLDRAEIGIYTVFVKGPSAYVNYSSDQGGAAAVYVRGAVGESETTEYVTLTVAAEGGGDHHCFPAIGVHTYVKGATITLTAGKYDNEEGEDYRYSTQWGLDVERYPFLGWMCDAGAEHEGSGRTVTLTLTEDTTLTWRWQDTPSEVRLWLETYNDYLDILMFPGDSYGAGYWMSYGQEVVLTAEDAPILQTYGSNDEELSVSVNGRMYVGEYDRWGYLKQRTFTTLRFTSFCVNDENGIWQYAWDETNYDRLPTSVTLPMTSFTVVDFGYADETDQHVDTELPFWWWARNFWGSLMNGDIEAETTYATGDADGDGCTNLREYKTGTDPRDAKSRLLPFTLLIQ